MVPAGARERPLTARELVLADEVLFLHSIYRKNHPSPPPPLEHPCDENTSKGKTKERPDDPWIAAADAAGPSSVPDPWQESQPPPRKKACHSLWNLSPAHQRDAVSDARRFFLGANADADDDSEGDDEDEEVASAAESDAYEFFLRMFTDNAALREYYAKSWENGKFYCLACTGSKTMKGAGREFSGLVALALHASSGGGCDSLKLRAAHRGFVRVACLVIGWDEKGLPSIVLASGEPLGRSLGMMQSEGKESDHAKGIEKEGKLCDQNMHRKIYQEDVQKEIAEDRMKGDGNTIETSLTPVAEAAGVEPPASL